jgi:hypothetical protein
LADRVLFLDSEFDTPVAAIGNLNSPEELLADIEAAVEAGFLVRTMTDPDRASVYAGDESSIDVALGSGAHLLSTDYPTLVPDVPYELEIPGGSPSRCNPDTAPPECTSEAIEDPERMER